MAAQAPNLGGVTEPIRVFLLDDHEIVRRGVAELLDAEPDLEVVGEHYRRAGDAFVRPPPPPGENAAMMLGNAELLLLLLLLLMTLLTHGTDVCDVT